MRNVAVLPIVLVALVAGALAFMATAPDSVHVATVTVEASSQEDVEIVAAFLSDPAIDAQVGSLARRADASVTDEVTVTVAGLAAEVAVGTTDAALSAELAVFFEAVAGASPTTVVSATSTSVQQETRGGSRWIPTIAIAALAAGAVAVTSELLRRRRFALTQARRAGLGTIGALADDHSAPALVPPRHIGVRRRSEDRPGHHHEPRFRLIDTTTSRPAR